MARQAFSGSIVAIVTPFNGERVDFPALKRLCDWHIAEGTQAIVPCGTTGESATFSHEEQHQVINEVVQAVAGRVPVIAGAGSNSTREAVSLAQAAERAKADGILTITPYYNKPTPEGLFQHFKAVREATRLPLVLYNVPGRTGINMLPETTERVWGLGNIDSIKEASGSTDQITDLLGRGVRVLSGDDSMTLPYMALGASGVISVVANFAPRLMRQLCDACARGDLAEARRLNHIVFDLVKVAFSETNPIPAKAAVHALGLCREEYRLPIVPMTPAKRAVLIATLTRHGLLARANAWAAARMALTLADKITLARLVLAPAVACSYLLLPVEHGLCFWVAGWLCAIAEYSDLVDGRIARARGEVSDFGKLADPFCDVFYRLTVFMAYLLPAGGVGYLVATTGVAAPDGAIPAAEVHQLVFLVGSADAAGGAVPQFGAGLVPWLPVLLMVLREIVAGALRAMSAVRGLALAARPSGKLKAWIQGVALITLMAWPAVWWTRSPWHLTYAFWMTWICAAFSVASIIEYMWVNRSILAQLTPARSPSGQAA